MENKCNQDKPTLDLGLMETERELNTKILRKTLEIRELFPELSVFLDEMPVDSDAMWATAATCDGSNLKAYFDSLDTLLNTYQQNTPNM